MPLRAAAAALALALAPAAAAPDPGPTLRRIRETGTISLGHRESSIPFSYYDDRQQVVGYSHEIMLAAVEAVRKELGLKELAVKLTPVTSQNRIPLVLNGTIDLECGSTTNNLEREKQVSFTMTHFVTANKFVAKRAAKLNKLEDLKGKTVVSTAGTTNIKQLTKLNEERNLGINIVSANGHPEAFQMVESGRAAAFVMDDILLFGLVANSKNPKQFAISKDALSVEPYGIMLRKDDAEFKKVVDAAMSKIYKSGEAAKLYAKWFQHPIPPRNINLNVPMSAQLKKVMSHPTDSGDPSDYK